MLAVSVTDGMASYNFVSTVPKSPEPSGGSVENDNPRRLSVQPRGVSNPPAQYETPRTILPVEPEREPPVTTPRWHGILPPKARKKLERQRAIERKKRGRHSDSETSSDEESGEASILLQSQRLRIPGNQSPRSFLASTQTSSLNQTQQSFSDIPSLPLTETTKLRLTETLQKESLHTMINPGKIGYTKKEHIAFYDDQDQKLALDIYTDAPLDKALLRDTEYQLTHRGVHHRPVNKNASNIFPYVVRTKQDRYFWSCKRTPVVDKVNPPNGDIQGGTRLEVIGCGFGSSPKDVRVFFSSVNEPVLPDVEGSEVTLLNENKLLCLTPAGLVHGQHHVIVECKGVRSKIDPKTLVLEKLFSFKGPTVVEVNPKKGAVAGGTMITIVGSFLGGGDGEESVVLVDGRECTEVNFIVPGKRLTCHTPPGKVGSYPVQVSLQTKAGIEVKSHITPKTMFEYLAKAKGKGPVGKKIKIDLAPDGLQIDMVDLFKRVGDPQAEMDQTTQAVRENLRLLSRVFWYYAMEAGTAGEDDPSDISKRQFRMFVEDSRFFGQNQIGAKLPLQTSDVIFVRANKEWEADDENSDNSLVFHEFIGAVVRIAVQKYPTIPTICDRVRTSCSDHLGQYAKKLEGQESLLQAIATEHVAKVLTKYTKALRDLFEKYCPKDAGNKVKIAALNFEQITRMMHDKGIVAEDKEEPSLPDIRKIFYISNMGQWVVKPVGDPCPCQGFCSCVPPEDYISVYQPKGEGDDGKKPVKAKARRKAKAEDSFDLLGFDEFKEFVCRLAAHINYHDVKVFTECTPPFHDGMESFLKKFAPRF